ncbi:MAG: ketol-acid reductoisomerase [Candidatus Altiarchaeales archaeon]|nr:MAG: ketol-acid reductoisomerase [Candidatus Altiarchaeales archaeon]RLI94716.1 MAG: ketol-acid reductoisomerase [Candidatus Altiarchaeales archaeon]HDO81893.1 ketol-acid reductoisomerase [Candidatus Altiarchaeales archaeon]HEX54542.1 ketol-acid reductoisomerase [Candidatus Altiarchaeales archaeon]
MVRIYYDNDVDLDILRGKRIAIIGYGNQGSAQAKNMRDSGLDVIIGSRRGEGWENAENDGFDVMPIEDAADEADIIHILIPDEVQPQVYEEKIESNLKDGNALMFSHGFNIRFKTIVPPDNIDVIMVAPKGPGILVRKTFLDGFGTPALIAVEQDYTGKAREIALALAKAIGSTRVGVIETTFKEETETDLFGEQVDLCGGVTELIKAAFDVLVEAGYQPELAYFETLHELKLITDLIQEGGLEYMWSCVSNTAEYGGRTRGKIVIDEHVRENMRRILRDIQNDKFATEWINEYKSGLRNLCRMREEEKELLIEKVGAKLRKMFKK